MCENEGKALNKATLKFSFVRSLPVMAGYLVLGSGFGILMADKGYSFWWPALMSIVVYAGSLQYVGVNLLATMASPISTALMTIMVNARHIFYGISMLEKYKAIDKGRTYSIFALTDETYSLVCSAQVPEGVDEHGYYLALSVMNQSYWVLGSLIGGLLGNYLNFNTDGIDFAMTALFIVMFVEQWESAKTHAPALCGLFATLICLLIFGSDYFLIPSMLLIAIILMACKNQIEGKIEENTEDVDCAENTESAESAASIKTEKEECAND